MTAMRIAKRQNGTAAFRLLLMLAIVMAAFAHRPAVSAPAPAELAQFALPDGTLPDLCLGGSPEAPSHHHRDFCDFCVIAGASAPAAPVADIAPAHRPVLVTVLMPVAEAPPVTAIHLATASKRGPPSLFS